MSKCGARTSEKCAVPGVVAACVGPMSAERRGALAGPESAAEHVRNALQLLTDYGQGVGPSDVLAARDRLVLAMRELYPPTHAMASDEMFERLKLALAAELGQPPRGAADATGTP